MDFNSPRLQQGLAHRIGRVSALAPTKFDNSINKERKISPHYQVLPLTQPMTTNDRSREENRSTAGGRQQTTLEKVE
jgi:hypothetical protein